MTRPGFFDGHARRLGTRESTGAKPVKAGGFARCQRQTRGRQRHSIEEIDHQEVFHYYRYVLKHGTVLVFTRVNIASDDLYVFFDRDGVVSQVLSLNGEDRPLTRTYGRPGR